MREKIFSNDELMYDYVVYENGEVFNITTNNKITPSIDPRRPNQPPIIYFKLKNNKRIFQYHDQLVVSAFDEKYDSSYYIHHIDGDPTNCKLSNLIARTGLDILRDIFKETKEWKKVELSNQKLYYDYYICEDGRLFNGTTGAYVQPFKDKRDGNYGNLRYNLYYDKGAKDIIKYSANRLVARYFLPEPPLGKTLVLFKDRDHSNLHYSNLYWGDEYDHLHQDIISTNSREFTVLKKKSLGKEKWKTLVYPKTDFAYQYKISNFGRIWNCDKGFYTIYTNTKQPNLNGQCYETASLKTIDRGYTTFPVHRLVAFMFCDNDDPKKKIFVNHINGNPSCNLAINLEWVTPGENVSHAIETNLTHTNAYKDKVNSEYWRLNTIYAWIYSIKNITDDKAYKMYVDYIERYNDNIPILPYDKFVNTFKDKQKNDRDFIKIFDFYKSQYQI